MPGSSARYGSVRQSRSAQPPRSPPPPGLGTAAPSLPSFPASSREPPARPRRPAPRRRGETEARPGAGGFGAGGRGELSPAARGGSGEEAKKELIRAAPRWGLRRFGRAPGVSARAGFGKGMGMEEARGSRRSADPHPPLPPQALRVGAYARLCLGTHRSRRGRGTAALSHPGWLLHSPFGGEAGWDIGQGQRGCAAVRRRQQRCGEGGPSPPACSQAPEQVPSRPPPRARSSHAGLQPLAGFFLHLPQPRGRGEAAGQLGRAFQLQGGAK